MAGRILFDQVWKRFHRGPAHDSLRDLIPSVARRLVGRAPVEADLREGDFWAIRDVSFEVRAGEALGIIGGNGAGKSTTLKLLTKILGPTRGTALVEGRVGSLIEVSAGFHPDLTGRENVFLQGAIMGMPQKLIRERFDEIVDFSGISAFIDTPVKRYSSGMNARLGFSIAVHLEPEVLIIDEVLSVGDAEFQGRAFERIRAMVRGSIPVVIVSHQLDRIVELCTSCIFLRQGQVAFHGAPDEAVHEYLHGAAEVSGGVDSHEGIELGRLERTEEGPVESGGRLRFVLDGVRLDDGLADEMVIAVRMVEVASNQVLYVNDLGRVHAQPLEAGPFRCDIELQANVAPGLYRLETHLWHKRLEREVVQGPSRLFTVEGGPEFHGTHQLNLRANLLSAR
jgi:ABC-type polysaccharide/polyol phosphate transport system ATPase subunit